MAAGSEALSKIWGLARDAELMRLTYIGPGAYPRAVPVWFVLIDDECYLGTEASSSKWRALQKNSRVGWVIDGGEHHKYWAVSRYGTAEEVMDATMRSRIYNALGVKYFGSATDSEFIKIYGQVNEPATVYLRLKDEGGNSWQY